MKVIDLTLPYDEQIAGFSKSVAKTLEKEGWNASTLSIYSHAGTHMDSPIHFGVGADTIDLFSPEDFICENTWVLKLEINTKNYDIKIADLKEIAQNFKHGDSLIIGTNWSKKLGTASYRDDLPTISQELAEWLVDKKAQILGVEPPSVADVNDLPAVTKIHRILLGNVIIVEGLCNIEEIESEKVKLIALPLKIKNGDGAPCRVIAIET